MSEQTRHTAEPWEAKREDTTERGWCVYDATGMLVARRLSESNARLIAAAPEMKDAIIEADGCFEAALAEGWLDAIASGNIEVIRDIWERRLSHARGLFPGALAKATGQS